MKIKTFEMWALEWLQAKKPFIKESTYGSYSTIVINHLIPTFGGKLLAEIKEEEIQQFVLLLLANGRLDGKGGLSRKTVKDILIVLQECMKCAWKENLIANAKFSIAIPGTKAKREIRIFDSQEQEKIICLALSTPNLKNTGILMSMQTGLRIGELCALRWKDIDLEKGIIHVTKTLQRIYIKEQGCGKSRILLDTPKSLSSMRSIPILKTLQNHLFMLYSHIPLFPDSFFLTGTLKYIEPRTYMRYYKFFLKTADINYVNFHALRHTFATTLIELGADYKTVSALLGHSSVTTTLDLYVHPQMDSKRRCVELLERG